MRLLSERGRRCERCKRRVWPLALHHKTYDRLGCEADEDLELLCDSCHEEADIEREEIGKMRSEDALYSARLDGWATVKYGVDWYELMDPNHVADEFDEWLMDHDEY